MSDSRRFYCLDGSSCICGAKAIKLLGDFEEIILDREGNGKLEDKNKALTDSKVKTKSPYSSWMMYFTHGAKANNDIDFEVMLAHWLSWYFFPSSIEDGISPYVF